MAIAMPLETRGSGSWSRSRKYVELQSQLKGSEVGCRRTGSHGQFSTMSGRDAQTSLNVGGWAPSMRLKQDIL